MLRRSKDSRSRDRKDTISPDLRHLLVRQESGGTPGFPSRFDTCMFSWLGSPAISFAPFHLHPPNVEGQLGRRQATKGPLQVVPGTKFCTAPADLLDLTKGHRIRFCGWKATLRSQVWVWCQWHAEPAFLAGPHCSFSAWA